MQKVKHLEYEHGNNCDRVKIDSQKVMKEERLHHTDKDKEMLKDKKKYKDDYTKDEIQNQGDIDNREKELD